jgi:[acyl-carrier-protein] S-malonyltransferase
MDSAYQKFGDELANVEMQLPRFPVVSNVTGEEVKTLPDVRRTLQDQITATVRWVDCMERLLAFGCELFIELGPGGTLAGLLQRVRKGVDVISVGDADAVREASERILAPA